MRFRASTFLVLLVFTFHELSSARCSDATSRLVDGDGGGAHRRGVVGRQDIVLTTEVTSTTGVIFTTTEDITTTESATTVIATRIMTATTTAATSTEPPTPTITILPAITTGGLVLTCPVGYYHCEARLAGGCCPIGFGCAVAECVPPATVTALSTCLPMSFSCPDLVSGGCCPDKYRCGATICSPLVATGSATVVTKGSAIPINAKIAASTTTADSPPTDDPKGEPLPKIVVVGIVVGSVIGTLLLVGVAWVTWYRLRKRGNTDVVSDRTRDDIVSAQTGRTYHPEQAPRRQQRLSGRSGRTQPAGLYTGPIDPAHQPVAAEMEVKPYSQDSYARETFDSQQPHLLDYKDQEHVELGDTSVQQHQERHEVEGDLPPSPGRTRRWSNGLERIHIRRGSNTNGSHGGGGTHF